MFKKRIDILMLSIFIILGIAFALQARTFINEELLQKADDERFVNLKKDLENEITGINDINKQIEENKKQIAQFEKSMGSNNTENQDLLNKIQLCKLVAGETDVEGPGIVISLNDAQIRKENSYISENDLIIHQSDIYSVLNELKIAGAQAISINEQRIVSTSEQVCAGPTISINKTRSAVPFIIKAIGNQQAMLTQLNLPTSYMRDLLSREIQVDISSQDIIRIPKYNGDLPILLKKAGDK